MCGAIVQHRTGLRQRARVATARQLQDQLGLQFPLIHASAGHWA